MLQAALHAGGAGCAGCVWTLILDCPYNSPANAGNQLPCPNATTNARCRPGQLLWAVYLSTPAITDQFIATACLGGIQQVRPVGQLVAAAAAAYMRNVHPPPVRILVQPAAGPLVSLPAYFQVLVPAVGPAPFGGGTAHEVIFIRPASYTWNWGDGTAELTTSSTGGPYPVGDLQHVYDVLGRFTVRVSTTWVGSYTFTVAGRTFGPLPAIGTVTLTQQLDVTVYEARSHLISG